MLELLIASNVLAGVAVALAFRPKAILLAAPLLAAFTAAVLRLNRFGAFDTFVWLCISLAAGQLAFLLTSAVSWLFSARAGREASASRVDGRHDDDALLTTGPPGDSVQPRDMH